MGRQPGVRSPMSDDRLDQLDYYDLLQIAPAANADEVRRAFHAFALRYHPDRFSGAPPEKQARAAQIYRRGAEAYRVLCAPDQRRAYDEQRARGKVRFDPDEVPPKAPPKTAGASEGPSSVSVSIKSPRARPFAQKADEAAKRGDWKTAKLNLKLALQHEPANPLLELRLREAEANLTRK